MSQLERKAWATADFESMGWHDNAVHALRIVEGMHGEGELLLDIDYIEEWFGGEDHFEFLVTPCSLRFHGVTELRVTLDYATPTAGLCPFSLDSIERHEHVYQNGHVSYSWVLRVNWPEGEITFHSPGFTQEQLAHSVRSPEQSLKPEVRGPACKI